MDGGAHRTGHQANRIAIIAPPEDSAVIYEKTAPHHDATYIDTTKPSIARAYDAVLGGKDNYEVDRAVAAELFKVMPEIGDLAWYNRAILRRGVRYLAAEAGIRQFIDLGSGLPTVENTHQVAQRHIPTARVVYVD